MPEYLAPGVYVEEVSFRAKSIEGVSTSTTGFVGPTRKGPLSGTPEVITSFGDFQRVFGGFENLADFPHNGVNYLAHGVQNYFDNGGSRLYVARVFQPLADDNPGVASSDFIGDGQNLRFVARFPGGAGRGSLTLRQALSAATVRTMGTAPQGTLVRIGSAATPARLVGGNPPPFDIAADGVLALTVNGASQTINVPAGQLTIVALNGLLTPAGVAAGTDGGGRLVLSTNSTGAGAELTVRSAVANSVHAALGLEDNATASGAAGQARLFRRAGPGWVDGAGQALNLEGQAPGDPPRVGTGPPGGDFVTMRVEAADADGNPYTYEDLGFDPAHPRYVGSVLALTPSRRAEQLESLFAIEIAPSVTAFDLHARLFATGDRRDIALTRGNDGAEPSAAAYRAAFERLSQVEDISIVAAPGHSTLQDFQAIQQLLIGNAEARRAYRIAVLETPPGQSPGEARTVRSRIDSRYAALYFPWIVTANPLARPGDETIPREVTLPPSGAICGIYARNDIERGVSKTPANEVIRGAIRFELDINFGTNEVLNPIGINCLRYFPGRGFRVWGGRTVSSDPEFKYVNVRRFMNYLEASIDRGTQWAVFENNGERLWANVRETISDFLYSEWRSGALLGGSPKEAFFVRCDRSTMTQNDLDNGRLVCLIGVAVLKPAEFVIFRIGQKTADPRN